MQPKPSFFGFIILVVSTYISGCDTTNYGRVAMDLGSAGKCDDAETVVRQHISSDDPGRAALLLGVIAVQCHKNDDLGIRYWKLSARYGNPDAQDALLRIGQPVPAADLKPKEDDITPFLIGIGAGIMSHRSPPAVNYAPPQGGSIPPMAPEGSGKHGGNGMGYTMCPDGTFVAGSSCVMTPNGTYVGRP